VSECGGKPALAGATPLSGAKRHCLSSRIHRSHALSRNARRRALGSNVRSSVSCTVHPAKAVSPSETRLPPHSTPVLAKSLYRSAVANPLLRVRHRFPGWSAIVYQAPSIAPALLRGNHRGALLCGNPVAWPWEQCPQPGELHSQPRQSGVALADGCRRTPHRRLPRRRLPDMLLPCLKPCTGRMHRRTGSVRGACISSRPRPTARPTIFPHQRDWTSCTAVCSR